MLRIEWLSYVYPSYRNGYNGGDDLQHFHWIRVREAVQKELKNCDTCQRTKQPNKNMVDYQLMSLIKYQGINYVYI